MQQKDFILREIEKMSILIQYLLGKYKPAKSVEEYQTNEKSFNMEFKEKYGKELEFFLNLNPQNFEKEFCKTKGFTFENIELMADLLLKLGNDDYSDSQKYLNQALAMYLFIDKTSKTFSMERIQKINELKME